MESNPLILDPAEVALIFGGMDLIVEAIETAQKNRSMEFIEVKHKLFGGQFTARLVFDERPKAPIAKEEPA